jgi:hypothetical protein
VETGPYHTFGGRAWATDLASGVDRLYSAFDQLEQACLCLSIHADIPMAFFLLAVLGC